MHPRHSAWLPAVSTLLLLSACGSGSVEWQPGDESGVELCEITLCFAGTGGPDLGGNPALADICSRLPGLLKPCSDGRCELLFHDADRALSALIELFQELYGQRFPEREQAWQLPYQDPPAEALELLPASEACEIAFVGHSWGAVNLAEVARRMETDDDVPEGFRRVNQAVLVDAYAPTAGSSIEISPLVKDAWNYRHSEPAVDDCSSEMPLGPYIGLPLRCSESTGCRDYDVSEDRGAVDHCGILRIVGAAIDVNVRRGRDDTLGFANDGPDADAP